MKDLPDRKCDKKSKIMECQQRFWGCPGAWKMDGWRDDCTTKNKRDGKCCRSPSKEIHTAIQFGCQLKVKFRHLSRLPSDDHSEKGRSEVSDAGVVPGRGQVPGGPDARQVEDSGSLGLPCQANEGRSVWPADSRYLCSHVQN